MTLPYCHSDYFKLYVVMLYGSMIPQSCTPLLGQSSISFVFLFHVFKLVFFFSIAHSTSSSLTDTMSLSSSDSDLHRDLGIPVTGSRLSTGAKNKPTTEVSESEAAKEVL